MTDKLYFGVSQSEDENAEGWENHVMILIVDTIPALYLLSFQTF